MPVPLIVLGAILLFFAFLLALRVRIAIVYKDDVSLTAHVLCFRIRLFPRKKKVNYKHYSPQKAERIAARKARKEAKKAERKAAKKAKREAQHALPPEKQKEATLPEKIALVRALAAALIRKTGKHLRLRAAKLHLRVATGDAAKTAILYGAVCQSLSYLLALLDRVTRLKATEPDVAVSADYLSEKCEADVHLIFSLRLIGAIAILFSVALAFLRTKSEQRATRKQKEKSAAKAARAKAQKGN
jgi:hypothetical protein